MDEEITLHGISLIALAGRASLQSLYSKHQRRCMGYATDYVSDGNKMMSTLILTSLFVLDFQSIHPFNDGNDRMARLLTLLLLYQYGFEIERYISLEKIVKSRKEDYYKSLRPSSVH